MIICFEFGKLNKTMDRIHWPHFTIEEGVDMDSPMSYHFYTISIFDFHNWMMKHKEARKLYQYVDHKNYTFGQQEVFIPITNKFVEIIDSLPIVDVKPVFKDLGLWLKAWTIMSIDQFGEDAGFCIY